MTKRMDREELVRLTAHRLGKPEDEVGQVVDVFLDEIYLAMKAGQSVTLKKFGGFYVRPEESSWVFRFNPSQKWRAMFGWSSTYTGE